MEPAATVAAAEVMVGAVEPEEAVSTSNCHALDVPPPGAGVCTVMAMVPAVAISAAVTCAVSWVALMNCVARAEDPQYAVELAMNPDPFTVSVNTVPPASVNAGEMPLIAGTGFTIE